MRDANSPGFAVPIDIRSQAFGNKPDRDEIPVLDDSRRRVQG
jgi:hypothetical protein